MSKSKDVVFTPKCIGETFPYCEAKDCPHSKSGIHTHRVKQMIASVDPDVEPVLPSSLKSYRVGKNAKVIVAPSGARYIVYRVDRESVRLYREVAKLSAPEKTYVAEHAIAHIEAEAKA